VLVKLTGMTKQQMKARQRELAAGKFPRCRKRQKLTGMPGAHSIIVWFWRITRVKNKEEEEEEQNV